MNGSDLGNYGEGRNMGLANGNGSGKKSRLPERTEQMLAGLVVQQGRIERETQAIFDELLSMPEVAAYLRPRFETIMEAAGRSRQLMIEETDQLRELMSELRDLRKQVARCKET
jgi:hypothetical protein